MVQSFFSLNIFSRPKKKECCLCSSRLCIASVIRSFKHRFFIKVCSNRLYEPMVQSFFSLNIFSSPSIVLQA
ncbi:hypothetical protein HanIR_Chr03g0105411 [Helianthus annuus]|nr:hypothetical protein HanIR_Chr03g0105411 [Helianthus annuus]